MRSQTFILGTLVGLLMILRDPMVAGAGFLGQDIVSTDSASTFHFSLLENREFRDSLLRRDNTPKPAAVTCPEDVGGAPLPCGVDVCGGEDASNKGHCTKEKCQCDSNNSAKPIVTMITATQAGKTATGSYALQTLTSYSGLRQAITTTLTETTTKADGSTGVQTAAAVVLAGGVAWFLAGYVGDAAVAESALEAPESDPGHEDDKSCPEPKEKCSDCGGKFQMCFTGAATGCGCEDANCPSGDQEPTCSDPNCQGGDDKKCTKQNAGCQCKDDKEACPAFLWCDDCGGSTVDGQCIGLADQNNKWKDCDCQSYIETTPYDPYTDQEVLDMATSISGLGTINDMSYEREPLNGDPVCLNLGWGAPVKEQDAKGGEPSVLESAVGWCQSVSNTSLNKDNSIVYQSFSVSYYQFWLSAEYWFESIDSTCGGDRKISEDECVETFKTAMEVCEPDSPETHGASLVGECIKYNITLAPSDPDDRPPWMGPLPDKTHPVCNTDRYSMVQSKFFSGLYPSFCTEVEKDSTQQLSKTLTNADYQSPAKRSLQLRTPPVDSDSYQDYRFNFEWTGSDGQECFKNCSSAFDYIVSSPCGQSGMAYSTTEDVGCGKYSYHIDSDQRLCGIDPSFFNDNRHMVEWNVDTAKRAIHDFCYTDAQKYGTVVDPAKPGGNTGFSQFGDDDSPTRDYRYGPDQTHGVTNIYVVFTENPPLSCAPATKFKVSDYSERCEKILNMVLADPGPCKRNGQTIGGAVKEESDNHGCVTWQIFQWSDGSS